MRLLRELYRQGSWADGGEPLRTRPAGRFGCAEAGGFAAVPASGGGPAGRLRFAVPPAVCRCAPPLLPTRLPRLTG